MYRFRLYTAISATLLLATLPPALHADIFEWEWIDPADPSQGKQQSATICPGGVGLNPGPGLNAYIENLTKGYLMVFDLTDANFSFATLTNADLTGRTSQTPISCSPRSQTRI